MPRFKESDFRTQILEISFSVVVFDFEMIGCSKEYEGIYDMI